MVQEVPTPKIIPVEGLAVDAGVVTTPVAMGGNTLTDATKNWAAGIHKNRLVKIVSGAGVGQSKVIDNNTDKTLIVKTGWVKPLDNTSAYVISEKDSAQILREVLNAGYDISAAHPLETHDPTIDDIEGKLDDADHGLAALKAALSSLAGGAFYGSYGPRNVEVGNDVDFGQVLYDPSGNIITVGEITPGTYTIRRVRAGVDSEVVASTPSFEAAGRVYMTYNFPAGWNVGDIFYITFSGIIVTIDGVATEYPNLYIWGRVVREAGIETKVDDVETKLDHASYGLEALSSRQFLYKNTLYVDANPAVGNDANDGSRLTPFLTIQAAVNAAPEYTTIMCVDSRVGAFAVGFDEKAAITGVTIATNYITIVGYSPNWVQGHKVFVTNSIIGADNVFNITGDHVALIGLATYLQDINNDEITVLCSGDSFRMEHCDLPNYIPGAAQNECIRVTGDNPVLDYVHTILSDVGFRFSGSVARVRNSTFQGAAEDGILLDATAIDTYIDSCQFQACGDGIHVTNFATYNAAYECNFANCATNWNNAGDATNQLIHAKTESQITAGNEEEQDLKDIYDRIGGVSTEATYSLPNDIAENSAFTITPTGCQRISSIMLDLSNLVQNADIRIKYDVHGDGAPFPTMETFNWTTGMDDIVYFREISGQRAVEVTVQSLVAQGAAKDIDYEYVLG